MMMITVTEFRNKHGIRVSRADVPPLDSEFGIRLETHPDTGEGRVFVMITEKDREAAGTLVMVCAAQVQPLIDALKAMRNAGARKKS